MFLRQLCPEDASALLGWLKDKRTNQWLEGDMTTLSPEDMDSFILRCMLMQGDEYRIIADNDGSFLGLAGLKENGELSLGLIWEAQGKGYAAAAADELLEYGFKQMGLEYIHARVNKENIRALRFCAAYPLAETGAEKECRLFRLDKKDFYIHRKNK